MQEKTQVLDHGWTHPDLIVFTVCACYLCLQPKMLLILPEKKNIVLRTVSQKMLVSRVNLLSHSFWSYNKHAADHVVGVDQGI